MRKIPGIIVALDVPTLASAGKLIEELAPHVAAFKIGMEICTAEGAPQAIRYIHERGGKVFLDLKFSDIPNTVGKAVKETAKLGVWMTNIHASCGEESIKAAAANRGETIILGVTVLTSIDKYECGYLFGSDDVGNVVERLTRKTLACGGQGVICSPLEVTHLKKEFGGCAPTPIFVTPGIRPEWAATQDQKRVMTPAEAILAGSDFLVIGRPITDPPKSKIGGPVDAVQSIIQEMEAAL